MIERLMDWWRTRELDRRVNKHGWTGIYVGTYNVAQAWTYSIGFDETLDQPEVVIFDLRKESANALLWQAYNELKDGKLRFEDGAPWGVEGPKPVWRKVDPSQISGVANWLGLAQRQRFNRTGQRAGLEAFQLVLPDPEGHYPWDQAYDEHLRPRQPALYLPENDADDFKMAPAEREARRLMGERGWTVVPVDGTPLCWAYSIGLAETLGCPDLICFGPTGPDAEHKLIDVQRHLRSGDLKLEDGLHWNGLDVEVCWRRVHESQYLGFGWFHLAKEVREGRTGNREPVEAFQMFIPDLSGLYPWEAGCDREMHDLQPMLFLPFDPARPPIRELAGRRRL